MTIAAIIVRVSEYINFFLSRGHLSPPPSLCELFYTYSDEKTTIGGWQRGMTVPPQSTSIQQLEMNSNRLFPFLSTFPCLFSKLLTLGGATVGELSRATPPLHQWKLQPPEVMHRDHGETRLAKEGHNCTFLSVTTNRQKYL